MTVKSRLVFVCCCHTAVTAEFIEMNKEAWFHLIQLEQHFKTLACVSSADCLCLSCRRCWTSSAAWSFSCRSPCRTLTGWGGTLWRTTETSCRTTTPPRPRTRWPNLKRTAGPGKSRPAGSGNVSARGESCPPVNNKNDTSVFRNSNC